MMQGILFFDLEFYCMKNYYQQVFMKKTRFTFIDNPR